MKAEKFDLRPVALSIDLEFWWCSELLRNRDLGPQPDIILPATSQILDLLKTYGRRSTFFVLGEVADKYPDLIKRIMDEGHEIANHGYRHRNIFELSPAEFEEDLKRSTDLLRSITSEIPSGYRAPNFSFDQRTVWAYDILEKYGYKYSSSVFPFKTALYGVPGAPLHPYKPSPFDIQLDDPSRVVLEFPGTVLTVLGRTFPMSGGFYFRLLPASLILRAFRRVRRARPAVFYLHLRDVYRDVPRLKGLPVSAHVFHYWGTGNALTKLETLLRDLDFITVRDVLKSS